MTVQNDFIWTSTAGDKECSRCLFTEDIAKIMPDGECEYCKLHDKLEKQSKPEGLAPILTKIANSKGKYNCLIGISGGLDSSTLLYAAVKKWHLKPLVIHFDNHWNNAIATENMANLVKSLNVDSITYTINKKEFDLLNEAFLAAGVPDADIPNDIAMTKLMYETADKYKIKYILNGHDFRTEGSTPAKWTYMDAKYIQSVYGAYTGKTLTNYPLFTFTDQIIYGLKGIKQVRPFHFGFDRESIEYEMIEETGWKSYGGKHCENIYTEFVGAYLLPNKFNIDKRVVYLSAQVRSGALTRKEAIEKMKVKPLFDLEKLGSYQEKIVGLYITAKKQSRTIFGRYNFKKYKFLIWLLAKIKVVPYTFYVKYAK